VSRQTGWLGGEGPEAEAPEMPVTNMLLSGSRGEPQPGAVLAQSLARAAAAEAREAAASAPDRDEYCANLVARGYRPGLVSGLSMRLGDTLAEIAGEEDKLERSARRQERIHRDHAAGRITAFDIARMQGADIDEGDPRKLDGLRRRADLLRQQIAEAQEAISPPQARPLDGVESASRHAHQVFTEVTRARMAEAQTARPEPRPFASVSRGAAGTEHTGPDCEVCAWAEAQEASRVGSTGEPNTYHMPLTGWEAVRAEDAAENVVRRGTEGAIVGLR
jgi:hypothetical protein